MYECAFICTYDTQQFVRKLIFESHAQLIKYWRFGIVGWVFDELEILTNWTLKYIGWQKITFIT